MQSLHRLIQSLHRLILLRVHCIPFSTAWVVPFIPVRTGTSIKRPALSVVRLWPRLIFALPCQVTAHALFQATPDSQDLPQQGDSEVSDGEANEHSRAPAVETPQQAPHGDKSYRPVSAGTPIHAPLARVPPRPHVDGHKAAQSLRAESSWAPLPVSPVEPSSSSTEDRGRLAGERPPSSSSEPTSYHLRTTTATVDIEEPRAGDDSDLCLGRNRKRLRGNARPSLSYSVFTKYGAQCKPQRSSSAFCWRF